MFFLWVVLEILYCNLSLILMRPSWELKEQYPLHAHTRAPEMLMWLFYCSKQGFGKWLQPLGAGVCYGGLVRGNQDKTDCGHQASGYKPMQAEKLSFQLNLEANICPWCKTNLIVPTSNRPAFSPGLRGLSPAPTGRVPPGKADSSDTSTAVSPYTTEV